MGHSQSSRPRPPAVLPGKIPAESSPVVSKRHEKKSNKLTRGNGLTGHTRRERGKVMKRKIGLLGGAAALGLLSTQCSDDGGDGGPAPIGGAPAGGAPVGGASA